MATQTTQIVSNATTSLDIQNAVRQQLLNDPRTSHLTPAQLQNLVLALSQQAAKQGMTPTQIMWTPGVAPRVNHVMMPPTQQALTSCPNNDPLCSFAASEGVSELWVIAVAFLLIIILVGAFGLLARMVKRSRT